LWLKPLGPLSDNIEEQSRSPTTSRCSKGEGRGDEISCKKNWPRDDKERGTLSANNEVISIAQETECTYPFDTTRIYFKVDKEDHGGGVHEGRKMLIITQKELDQSEAGTVFRSYMRRGGIRKTNPKGTMERTS